MPIFIDRYLLGYKVSMCPNDRFRKFIHRFFPYDIVPYMYGSKLMLKLRIKPMTPISIEESIQFEWNLQSVDGSIKFEPRRDAARISPNKGYTTEFATDLLIVPTQYKLGIKIIKDGNKGQYETIGLFTINDRDKFYETFFWLLVGAFITIVAGIIGYLIGVR